MSEAEGKRVALVIGNSAYQHANPLANPPNDARDIASALTRIGFSGIDPRDNDFTFDMSRPGTLAIGDLDYNRMRRALAAFGRASVGADQAILYYAGHGIEVEGKNYLIPVDARIEHAKDVEFETASLMQVLGAIDGTSGLSLVILDACRDNPFRARLFGTRNMSRGLRAVEPDGNILVAYAAKHGTVALDDVSKSPNSPYAKALLTHIETPGLEIIDLFRKVKDEVKRATSKRQEPYLYGSLGETRAYLVAPQISEPPPPIVPPRQPDDGGGPTRDWFDHTFWKSIVSDQDPGSFEEYLVQFPSGVYAGLAARRSEERIANCETAGELERLLQKYPKSPRYEAARQRLAAILWKQLSGSGDIAELEAFAERFRTFSEAKNALARSVSLRWQALKDSDDVAALDAFAGQFREYPESKLALGRIAKLTKKGKFWKAIAEFGAQHSRKLALTGMALAVATLAAVFAPNLLMLLSSPSPPIANRPLTASDIAARKPGDTFSECAGCPEMVVVPAGSFLMGSPKDEAGRDSNEDDGKGNQVPVTIGQSFAVGKFEVTFAEWEACVAGGGCKSNPAPSDSGWGKGKQPVINVSWNDAQEFVAWLNQTSSLVPEKPYRLLTEAEWEYAARGGPGAEDGGRLPYWWGKDIRRGSTVMANCDGCGSQWDNKQAAPVGQFAANPFGLHDMNGNVWEWAADSWHDTYANAPRNGSEWVGGNETQRVVRGGSWDYNPRLLRSADRGRIVPDLRVNDVGFRVARTLSP